VRGDGHVHGSTPRSGPEATVRTLLAENCCGAHGAAAVVGKFENDRSWPVRKSSRCSRGLLMTKTLSAPSCGRDLRNRNIRRADYGRCALRRMCYRRQRAAGRCAAWLCVLSRLWGTAARAQLLLVPHAGLRHLWQDGRLARASSGVLFLVSRLSSVAPALTAHYPRRVLVHFGHDADQARITGMELPTRLLHRRGNP
jgi:hypothetical protein